MRILLLTAISSLSLLAQYPPAPIFPAESGATIKGTYRVATLPGAGTIGDLAVVIDGSAAGLPCTVGGGSVRIICQWTGQAWVPLIGFPSGNFTLRGTTSGSATVGVAAVAGSPNRVNLPTATGAASSVLQSDGANPQQTSWQASTGTGNVVRASNAALTSPSLTTPSLGVATATSVNKVAVTAPATSATLTLSDGSSLITSGGDSITLTSTAATNVTLPTSGTLLTSASTPTCAKYTVASTNAAFQVAGLTATVPLFTLPQYGKVIGVTTKHSASFSDDASAMTNVGVTVGDSSSATAFNASQNVGEGTAPGDAVFTDSGGGLFSSTTMAAGGRAVNAYFTAVGANFGQVGTAITAATNASVAELTAVGHAMQTGSTVIITGFGGTWAPANGTYTATVTGADTFTTTPAIVSQTVSAAVFTGTGLDDATSGGTYSGAADAVFTVEIDAEAVPDTFRWRKDAGAWTAGVAITGGIQALAEGVTITFAANTGHTLTDSWAITTTTYGAIAGAPVFTANHLVAGSVDFWVCTVPIQ